MASTSTPPKKQDRTTVPAVAALVATGISAYGFQSESALLRWILPLALVAGALVWALWPRRAATERQDAPR